MNKFALTGVLLLMGLGISLQYYRKRDVSSHAFHPSEGKVRYEVKNYTKSDKKSDPEWGAFVDSIKEKNTTSTRQNLLENFRLRAKFTGDNNYNDQIKGECQRLGLSEDYTKQVNSVYSRYLRAIDEMAIKKIQNFAILPDGSSEAVIGPFLSEFDYLLQFRDEIAALVGQDLASKISNTTMVNQELYLQGTSGGILRVSSDFQTVSYQFRVGTHGSATIESFGGSVLLGHIHKLIEGDEKKRN